MTFGVCAKENRGFSFERHGIQLSLFTSNSSKSICPALPCTQLTLLHVAAVYDSAECLLYLLDWGVPTDAKSGNDVHPLHYAAAAGSIECAALLLDRGANPSYVVANCSPLLLAARVGSALIINMLFDKDVQLTKTSGQLDPLSESLRCKHLDCFHVLLQRGLVPHASGGNRDYSPLMHAINSELYDAVPILLDNGVDVNFIAKNKLSALYLACSKRSYKVVKMLEQGGLRMDVRGPANSAPIHWAAMSCVPDIVRFVIEQGADVNAVNNNGETAIAEVLRFSVKGGGDDHAQRQERGVLDQIATLKILVEHGLSVNGRRQAGNDRSFFVQNYLTRPQSVDVRVLDYMFSAEYDPLDWRLETKGNETLGDFMWKAQFPSEKSEVKTFIQQKLTEMGYKPKK